MNQTPLLGFLPFGDQKFADIIDGTTPTQEQHRKLTKLSTRQIKYPRVKRLALQGDMIDFAQAQR